MSKLTRRDCLQGSAALLTATSLTPDLAAAAVEPRRPPKANRSGIKLAELFSPGQVERFRLSRQIGINHAIDSVSGELSKVRREQYVEKLTQIKNEFQAAGLTIAGVESHPVPAEKIKLGLDG